MALIIPFERRYLGGVVVSEAADSATILEPNVRKVSLDLDSARARRALAAGPGFPSEDGDPKLATVNAQVAQILRIASAVSRAQPA